MTNREKMLEDERDALLEFAMYVGREQQRRLTSFRELGIVFNSLVDDPKSWEHVAFSLYCDLVDISVKADQLVEDSYMEEA